MPVDLRDMDAETNTNFDVYVHLPFNHRSVLMRRAGSCVENKQLDKFLALKQQMYIKKTQMKQFFEYARTVMSLRNAPFPVSMTEKFHRSKKAIYEIMAQFLNGATTDYQEGKMILDKCRGIVADFELTRDLDSAEILQRFFALLATHALFITIAFAFRLMPLTLHSFWAGMPANEKVWRLQGCCIILVLSQLPVSVGDKPFDEYSPEELAQYRLYPERSVVMVKSKKVPLPQEISDAIGQHRENVLGKGFPKALNELSEMGKLMGIVYRFHEMTALKKVSRR